MFRLSLLLVVITFDVWLRNVSSIVVTCGYNCWGLPEECFVYRCFLLLYLLGFTWGMFRLSLFLVVINFDVCRRNVSSIVVTCGYNFWSLPEECFVYRYYLWLQLLRFAWGMFRLSLLLVVTTFEVCLRKVSSIVVTCGYNFWCLTEESFVYRC
jgi:hypothetical protein